MRKITLLLSVLLLFSCAEEKKKGSKKIRSYLYVILDKSSSSYSPNGGFEENYIDVDTVYLSSFIDELFFNEARCRNSNEIILYFNYVDASVKGNKEVYMRLPVIPVIDTIYVAQPGDIESKEKVFEQNVKRLKERNRQLINKYKNEKAIKLKEIDKLLIKSKESRGSDCSALLKYADRKIENVLIDTLSFVKGKSVVIAFSDLVNFPYNVSKIDINSMVLRPGYTGEVPYIQSNKVVNFTSNEEFEDYLKTYLRIN